MGVTTAATTTFQIRPPPRDEAVREAIPADHAVVLVTGRASSYDATELSAVRQQKCVAHLQRSLSQVLVTKYGRGRSFTKQFKGLLTEAAELWRRQRAGPVPDWEAQ